MKKTHNFLIQNKLQWYIRRLLRGRTVSEKLSKIPLFGPSSVTASWISATSAKWSLLTSFSTWRTENSLAEINLARTVGGLKFVTFLGSKLANTCSIVGGQTIVQQEKISRAEHSWTNPLNALQEAIHYFFIKFRIYCFPVWYEFFVHYALRVEKNYQLGLDAGPLVCVSSAEEMSHQPIQNSVALLRGSRRNNRSHLHNNFVKKNLSASDFAIMS